MKATLHLKSLNIFTAQSNCGVVAEKNTIYMFNKATFYSYNEHTIKGTAHLKQHSY